MQVNFDWTNGLVFGIQADEIWPTTADNPNPNFDEPPDTMIVLYLGFVIKSKWWKSYFLKNQITCSLDLSFCGYEFDNEGVARVDKRLLVRVCSSFVV